MTASVLVVDDSPVVRAVLRKQLEEYGYVVHEAEDGQAALNAARQTNPSLVLLDVEMPRLDGHAVLAAMQAEEGLADVPVVFLTGRATSADVADGLSRGAHDYLRKPFDPAELLARVVAAVRTKGLQDALRQRNRDLELLSHTDSLTGLHNRRFLDEQLRTLVSRSRRHSRPLSVVLVDIDHFKRVNDSLGHEAGDAVIVAIAERLAARLRDEDVVGRWGGEEFLALLPDIDADGVEGLADGLRRRVAAVSVRTPSGLLSVTASFGAATWAGEEPDRLVARADEALYAAKHSGRNAVRLAA